MDDRPLPRSLLPLPGESLPGLLLRLAHRLDLSPGRLSMVTGLVHGGKVHIGRSTTSHLLMLTSSDRDRFASSLRLLPQQADQLTMRPLFGRFPPVAEALTRPSDPSQLRPRGYFPPWLLGASTRYCPFCLAGDGSDIQRRHGGAWKLQWRLGVVFLCTEHRIFLQDACPACEMPAHCGHPTGTLKLVASATIGGLHPAQCRNVVGSRASDLCGDRMDAPGHIAPSPPPSVDVIRLQQRLLGLLHPSHDAASAFTAFSDLQVVAAIVCATWPAAATVTPEHPLATALDDHVAEVRQADPEAMTHIARGNLWVTPPRSAIATAGLLDISSRLLALPPDALEHALRVLLSTAPAERTSGWGNTWRLLQGHGSRLLQERVISAVPTQFTPGSHYFATARRRARQAVIPARIGHFEPDHIPQWLPDDWFSVMFTGLSVQAMARSIAFRRYAAVQLVQIAADMPFNDAVSFLGLPEHWHRGDSRSKGLKIRYNSHYRFWRSEDLATSFTALAQHVSQVQQHTDYRSRRLRFGGWTLGTDAWADIEAELRRRHGYHHVLSYPASFLRGCSSKFIWSRVTGSEWSLAPTSTELAPGGDEPTSQRETRVRRLLRNPTCSIFFRTLKAALIRYSDSLTA
ncbi:TniQ family protein [Streptomyces olivaceoviridis]|uniref:TniQ family protein n=1 Tax=Streptomyces TaxID=1883 RepID=UPI0036A004D9